MNFKRIQIVNLTRLPRVYEGDELRFEPGVNVIAGEKDAGKTKWLQMLDYLLGETGPPEEAFGEDMAQRYNSIRGVLRIGSEEVVLERKWKEQGSRSKVFVNDEPINASDFSSLLLQKLRIPILRFPKGNPYDDRTWPELSWRMLYRHIYRQERFWADFAERQPLGEQHACLAQFLGVAAVLYPVKFGELVKKQKELTRIQAQRENFSATLQVITKDLLNQKEMEVAVTVDSVDKACLRLREQLRLLQARRDEIFAGFRAKQRAVEDKLFQDLKMKKAGWERQLAADGSNREKLTKRLGQLSSYFQVVTRELDRIRRLKSSGKLLADFKVTQCPVCDQPVEPPSLQLAEPVCYLCGKAHAPTQDEAGGSRRLEFEELQLEEEKSELEELQSKLRDELQMIDNAISSTEAELRRADESLAPAKVAAAALLPPDLEILSESEGRIKEQLDQLTRVQRAIDQQRELGEQVVRLLEAERELKSEIERETPTIDLMELAQRMEDGMNSYLNVVSESDPQRWNYGPVSFYFGERTFHVRVKKRRWDTQLGAASQALVLFAYHYALLSLVTEERFNYPGLVIVDFPVELMDSKTIGEGENYLIEPFVELCAHLGLRQTQFIAAGRSFLGLAGANRIRLERSPNAEDEVSTVATP